MCQRGIGTVMCVSSKFNLRLAGLFQCGKRLSKLLIRCIKGVRVDKDNIMDICASLCEHIKEKHQGCAVSDALLALALVGRLICTQNEGLTEVGDLWSEMGKTLAHVFGED